MQSNIDKRWLTPVIQGFLGHFSCYIDQTKKIKFYLIARRSVRRAGTRYNHRGLDDEGNVANYCEIEQIFYYNQYCCSYTQIRGSAPIFFQQRGITAKTKISRSFELTNSVFLKHIQDIQDNYEYCLMVNLMKAHKEDESIITKAFEEHIKHNRLNNIRYEFFDLHYVCGQNFEKMNPIIYKLHQMNENFKFYAEDLRNHQVLLQQRGVIRTNCLDCLDRTNIFQAKLALDALDMQLQHLGYRFRSAKGKNAIECMESMKEDIFMKNFRWIWSDCGDYISEHYTGTGSTHTDVTRYAERKFWGYFSHGMNSIQRFYQQNIEDMVKQEAIDMMTGTHTQITNLFEEKIENELNKKLSEFCQKKNLNLYITTWNIDALDFQSQHFEPSDLFDFEDQDLPDLIVIGLQDIKEATAYQVMNWNATDEKNRLKNIFESYLSTVDNYLLVHERDLYGLLILVYVKSSYETNITDIKSDKVNSSYIIHNQGATVVSLNVFDCSFSFINAQLQGHNNQKLSLVDYIHQNAFQVEASGKRKEKHIKDHDFKFLFGDLDFHINLVGSEIQDQIYQHNQIRQQQPAKAQEIINYLKQYDEITQVKSQSQYMQEYQENPITFLPTAKYQIYSTSYDFDRNVGWPDRIMISYSNKFELKWKIYNRRECHMSSHRPVSAYYQIEVLKFDNSKKEQIIKELCQNKDIDKELSQKFEQEERDSKLCQF